ncbi:hypothetical protein [Luteirhabdus pelagi]|jgi:hypothetical protein|uniref:hypothetical protein n=1 Tax=Luteirhabdus pelagi TaxID=2792783 RepID=UPI00193A920D|nr:hypothetical protein [Luteirhabdus pelagi]
MTLTKPNTGFWIIAVIALIWNIMGVFAFLGQTLLLSDDAKAILPEDQLTLLETTPTWLTIVFAIATIAGLLGSILLLAKRKVAIPVFGISLLAVLVQNFYGWLFTDAAAVYGTVQGYVIPLVVIIIAIFLYYYSKGAAQKGWLR